jgi:hypothetical protein
MENCLSGQKYISGGPPLPHGGFSPTELIVPTNLCAPRTSTPGSTITQVMAIEEFEFTIDDVLAVHRGWITKLFVEDMKSEVEIVQLLYERQFIVT